MKKKNKVDFKQLKASINYLDQNVFDFQTILKNKASENELDDAAQDISDSLTSIVAQMKELESDFDEIEIGLDEVMNFIKKVNNNE